MESLKKDFWAASSKGARDTKRSFVVELARTIGGDWWSPPLDANMILNVAAAVKEAKLRSGAAIINDLKLWHVEQGCAVPEWMARMLKLAKKSVTRNMGPPKRAVEVRIADQPDKLWTKPRPLLKVTNAALAYAWAVVWMLRCAEVVNVKRRHVLVTVTAKTITLTIPVSKMDQKALGVRRAQVFLELCMETLERAGVTNSESRTRGLRIPEMGWRQGQDDGIGWLLERHLPEQHLGPFRKA